MDNYFAEHFVTKFIKVDHDCILLWPGVRAFDAIPLVSLFRFFFRYDRQFWSSVLLHQTTEEV